MLDAFICQAEGYRNAESYRNEEGKRWGRQGEGRVGVGKVKAAGRRLRVVGEAEGKLTRTFYISPQ